MPPGARAELVEQFMCDCLYFFRVFATSFYTFTLHLWNVAHIISIYLRHSLCSRFRKFCFEHVLRSFETLATTLIEDNGMARMWRELAMNGREWRSIVVFKLGGCSQWDFTKVEIGSQPGCGVKWCSLIVFKLVEYSQWGFKESMTSGSLPQLAKKTLYLCIVW